MRIIASLALALLLFGVHLSPQNASTGTAGKDVVGTNQCLAKGGIGIIRQDLYIDLKSPVNKLLLSEGRSWSGKSRHDPELVIFFGGRIWRTQMIPEDFDLSKSVIVSFEGETIRFFDFAETSGGYYRREPAN